MSWKKRANILFFGTIFWYYVFTNVIARYL